jgi:hypothetical protein
VSGPRPNPRACPARFDTEAAIWKGAADGGAEDALGWDAIGLASRVGSGYDTIQYPGWVWLGCFWLMEAACGVGSFGFSYHLPS